MIRFSLFCCLLMSFFQLTAQSAYQIKVKVDGFTEQQAFLGYHYGDKQYIRDSVMIGDDGYFTFEGTDSLEGGVYLFVMPPDNDFFQILVSDNEHHFTVETKKNDAVGAMKIKGAPDNQLFYDYMHFLDDRRIEAERISGEMEKAKADETKKKALEADYQQINTKVVDYQTKLVANHPKTLTAAIVKAAMEINIPEFSGEYADLNRWQYVKAHWFDNIAMDDPRLLRSPVQFGKVEHYIEKLTVQSPDSLAKSVDAVLKMVEPAEESFKYYLIHFLNKYAKSKIVGMDALYVHLVENYYKTGKAPWTEEEQLNKIIKNANTLKPILIGKIAPNIKVFKQDKTPINLHDLESKFTVMFFWDPDCGHCKKSMPKMLAFYDKYKSKGVEVFAICTKVGKDNDKCWETIEEKKMNRWVNVTDQYLQSKYKTIYDIRTTPQIFILDADKKIVSKRIGAEQLDEVMEQLLEIEQRKLNSVGTGKK